jgi:hypothetical protein
MRLARHFRGLLSCSILLAAALVVRAETTAQPLRLISDQADFVVQVHQPRKLVESITTLDILKQALKIEAVREIYDSTNYRRFFKLVGYFEKELGHPWPELLDRLAGGGMAVASKFNFDAATAPGSAGPAPIVLVIECKDTELLRKFVKLGLQIIEQELARAEAKERPHKHMYESVEVVSIGKEFHAAVVGSALVVSNNPDAMQTSLDLHLGLHDRKSISQVGGIAESRKLLPPDPLASLWVNFETVRKAPQAKEVFANPRNDQNITVIAGGLLDVAGRTPYLCAGFYRTAAGFLTTVRMPRGRDGMYSGMALHIPPGDKEGTLPLLEPKGVLFSTSFYFDLAKVWEDRAKIFAPAIAESIEKVDKQSATFLAGNKFSQLLTQAGARHRFVAVYQPKGSYKTEPAQAIPAFAFVTAPRDPAAFSKSLETVGRGLALIAGNQANQLKLKLEEETYHDVKIVGYRFPEDAKVQVDVNNLRFNFSPCFARVGDSWMASSTIELARELVDTLKTEASQPKKMEPTAIRTQFYSAGGVEYLKAIEDQLLAQTILAAAVTPDEAKQQVQLILDLARKAGVLSLATTYESKEFHFDIELKLKK